MPAQGNTFFNGGRLGLGPLADDLALNIADGGMNGFAPDLARLDTSTPLVLPPVTLVVLTAPTMFESRPQMVPILKRLIEVYPKEVTGLEFGYTMGTSDTPVGHNGQTLKVPTDHKISEVNPSFSWTELAGNMPIWNFIHEWHNMIKLPETQGSTLSILQTGERLPMVDSSYAMTMMAIQHDQTYRPDNVIDAAIYTNMFPTETGNNNFQRVLGQSTVPERQIPFTAMVQHNAQTKRLGQIVSSILSAHRVDTTIAPPVTEAIDSALRNLGLEQQMQRILAEYQPANT